MSHEIRTPINAVLGMDEMILRHHHHNAECNHAVLAGSIAIGTLEKDIEDYICNASCQQYQHGNPHVP